MFHELMEANLSSIRQAREKEKQKKCRTYRSVETC